jgi:plastocyanin domain-containing protein
MRLRLTLSLLALVALAAVNTACGTAQSKEIHVTVTENGFEPNEVTIKNPSSTVLVMTRKTERTCATEAIFRETGRKYDLPMNEPVRIDLSGVQPGATLHYACGMDMLKGTVMIAEK